jgi:hypothetical protein
MIWSYLFPWKTQTQFSDTNTECSICLESYDKDKGKFILTDCQHAFHKDCIRESMKRTNICPMCRKEINYVDYQRVGLKKSLWDKALKYTEWFKAVMIKLSYPSFENAYKLYIKGLELLPIGERIIDELSSNHPETIYPAFFYIKKGDTYRYKLRRITEDEALSPQGVQSYTANVQTINIMRAYDLVDIYDIDYSYFWLDVKLDNDHEITIVYVPNDHPTVMNDYEVPGWDRMIKDPENPNFKYEIVEEEII